MERAMTLAWIGFILAIAVQLTLKLFGLVSWPVRLPRVEFTAMLVQLICTIVLFVKFTIEWVQG